MKKTLAAVLLLSVLCALPLLGKKRRAAKEDRAAGNFDYYVLALSWAPNFCVEHPNDSSNECRPGERHGFILHGLWPQADSGPPPMDCGGSPVAGRIVQTMLNYMPSASVVQHEWTKHGSCSGRSAEQYFAKARRAFQAVRIPDRLRQLDHAETLSTREIEHDFSTLNSAPPEAIRLSCHDGKLVAVEACLDKELHYRACTQSVRECPTAAVRLSPVR